MGGLKKMLTQLTTNFKKTEFWTNTNLQVGIIIAATIITLISKLLPELRENILAMAIGSIVLFGPIAIWGIYHGVINDDRDDDHHQKHP